MDLTQLIAIILTVLLVIAHIVTVAIIKIPHNK